MSRRIDPNRPFTEEEKAYLRTRAHGAALIEINERQFAQFSDGQRKALRDQAEADEEFERQEEAMYESEDDDDDGYHVDDVAQVQDLTLAEIRQRLAKEGLPSTVSKEDKFIPGTDETLTDKQVLAYRLLDFLDAKRG